MAGNISDLQYCCIVFLLWLASVIFFLQSNIKKPAKPQPYTCLPPSPPALPIIGHLHLFFSRPQYKSLQKLSTKYGPLLYLRAHNWKIGLVSSASMAYEILRTQELDFATHHAPPFEDSLFMGSWGFFTAPYGDYWKFMKRIVVTELLGQQHLEISRGIRAEELESFFVKLLNKARKSEVVDVLKEITRLINNIICRMAMSTRCSAEDNEAEKIGELVSETLALSEKYFFVAAALRSLKRFGISPYEKDFMNISAKYDDLLDKIIKQHEENPDREHKDMMDILLQAYRDEKAEFKITKRHIKAFFVDIILGGTDNSAQSAQWTMAELINHPEVFKKVREEVESVVGRTRLIQESDFANLPYLQAVVKEGLRLHPPASLYPRTSHQGCKVGGYDIPKGTLMMINAYAIMRDPALWDNPNEFYPERFLVASKGQDDMKGQCLSYFPFGSGRRGCPGVNLAYIIMKTAIGTMVQCFDWKIPGDKANMEEGGDMILRMAHSLKCTPFVHSNPLSS